MQNGTFIKPISNKLREILLEISNGLLGDPRDFEWLKEIVGSKQDRYLISEEFESYLAAQFKADFCFQNKEEWTRKSLLTALRISHFSSDRAVEEYCTQIWLFKQENKAVGVFKFS